MRPVDSGMAIAVPLFVVLLPAERETFGSGFDNTRPAYRLGRHRLIIISSLVVSVTSDRLVLGLISSDFSLGRC